MLRYFALCLVGLYFLGWWVVLLDNFLALGQIVNKGVYVRLLCCAGDKRQCRVCDKFLVTHQTSYNILIQKAIKKQVMFIS